jgi:hypothetical protein
MMLADRSEKSFKHIPDFVPGLWLVLMGLVSLLNTHFRGSHAVREVIVLLPGVFMIIRRSDKPFQSLSLVRILPPIQGAMTVYAEAKQVVVLQSDWNLTREH